MINGKHKGKQQPTFTNWITDLCLLPAKCGSRPFRLGQGSQCDLCYICVSIYDTVGKTEQNSTIMPQTRKGNKFKPVPSVYALFRVSPCKCSTKLQSTQFDWFVEHIIHRQTNYLKIIYFITIVVFIWLSKTTSLHTHLFIEKMVQCSTK